MAVKLLYCGGARSTSRRTLLVPGYGLCELDLRLPQSEFRLRDCDGDLAQRRHTPDRCGDSKGLHYYARGPIRADSCHSQRLHPGRLWIRRRGGLGTIRTLVSQRIPARSLNGQIGAYADAVAFEATTEGQLTSARGTSASLFKPPARTGIARSSSLIASIQTV